MVYVLVHVLSVPADDKNNALSIFMLSGSIQFSLPFQFDTNHAIFLNNAFEPFLMINSIQYIYSFHIHSFTVY